MSWQSESDGIATGTEGKAWYTIAQDAWHSWFQIHPETVFDHTTQQVTALARNDHHIDLFVIGFDNKIWSTWWEPMELYIHWDNPFAGTNFYEQGIAGPYGLYFSGGKGYNTEAVYTLIPNTRKSVPRFLPSRHGFSFGNHWPSIHITSITLPDPFGDILIGDASWGLCGGMSFASRDYFEAGLLAPSTTINPTGEGDPLFDYIVRRLSQSLGVADVADFVKYGDPVYPDTDDPTLGDGRNWVMAHSSWPAIRDTIDSGHPCPIGIVIGTLTDPTKLGHQICVYAYQLDGQELTLWVYDPNSPLHDDITLRLDISRTYQHLINVQHNVGVDHPISRFFVQPYEQRAPVQGRPPS